MAEVVERASFVQDVAIAATRLLYEAELTPRERMALENCRTLLRQRQEGEAGDQPPVDGAHLEPKESASLLRASRAALPSESLPETLRVLDLVLEGGMPNAEDRVVLANLRDSFLSMGRANLESVAAAKNSERDLGLWEPLRTSSLF
jgi:hypothetical protein